ncbi:MAG: glycosyltransferase [Clostridia bacterium]
MKKVSIVIPIYNSEKYLQTCLDSILAQTLKEIEIIAVNDGSKDRSREIIEEYQKRYPSTIHVINKENGGMSDARNKGVEKATGEYISFVDSDDYIEPTMLEKMYQKAKEGNFDMVTCDTKVLYPKETIIVKSGIEEDKKELTIEEKKKLLHDTYAVVWNKIYRREGLAEKMHFKEKIWYEDVLYLYSIIPHLNSVGVVKEPLYNYIQNQSSITYTYNQKLYDLITVCDELLEVYKKEGNYETYQDILEYIYVRYLFATFIKRLAKAKDKEKFNEGVKKVQSKVKETFPNYSKNKYIQQLNPKSIYLRFFGKPIANIIYQKEKNKMN